MQVTGYKIVKGRNSDDLVWVVEDLLVKGWQPLGGPYVAGPQAHMQAMVKYQTK